MKVTEEAVSSAISLGEYGQSKLMAIFSIEELEEKEERRKKQLTEYKKAFNKWKSGKTKAIKKHGIRRGVDKSFYSPGDPPFPGADVLTSDIMSILASNEYWEKPYEQERLARLAELSSPLKANIVTYARNTVGLDIDYIPSKRRKLHEFTPEELIEYHIQGKDMLNWMDEKTDIGLRFCKVSRQHVGGKIGIGEGYMETIRNQKDEIVRISFVSSQHVFELRTGNGYVWTKNGTKMYYKKFGDLNRRNKYTFDKGGSFADSATELIPYKEMCEISSIYGVPGWTPNIPNILGSRYADERNVNFFLNDCVPRIAILVSGGRVDDSTVEDAKKFFRQGKGREHFGRALILSVSGKNTLAGTKIPTIKIEKLGLGENDDASFMKYKEVTAQTIREAFQQAGIFLGSTGDSNRASSYTLRDMTVEGVYAAESRDYAHLVNETLVPEFAKERGFEDLLVELVFVIPRTMSRKDFNEFKLAEVQAGVTTINDYRTANGMDKIDKWWAELSSKLIVPAMQMSELSPDLVESLTGYSEFEPDNSLEGTTKSLIAIRKALVSLTKQPSHKITKESMEILDDWFKKRWS